ncbi:MAG: hypothetical protein ACI854_000386 [Arenicella sp.]|jgi:uncharacterized protein (DUF3820 family)
MHNDSSDAYQHLGFSKADLIKLARWQMPFGKYAGRVLVDLPEEYLFWFQRSEFPKGELGELMKLCLELKIEGLDTLIKPLKHSG